MSRTKKGAKGPGWETWSKRPYSCAPPGRQTKRLTNKKERAGRRKEDTSRDIFEEMSESLDPENHPPFSDEDI